MRDRSYQDLRELRRDVARLILAGKYGFTLHARTKHTEIPLEEKLGVILRGGLDQPNAAAPPGRISYVCWRWHPRYGLLRGVYAVSEDARGARVLVITGFPEEELQDE